MDAATTLWKERYRPHRVADCILPPRIKETFQALVDRKDMADMVLYGPPGCGKTSIARAACEEMGADHIVINGSDERGIDVIRGKVQSYASAMSLTGGTARKVVIFDEADYMTDGAQAALRGVIDAFEPVCRFVFTCNYPERLIPAIRSRGEAVAFVFSDEELRHMMAQLLVRCKEVLTENGVEFELAAVAAVIKKYAPDFRRVLVELQGHSLRGPIDQGVLRGLEGARVDELVDLVRSKNFKGMRQFFADNPSMCGPDLYHELYRAALPRLVPRTIPEAVVLLADYQYKASRVVSQEINAVACCAEMMRSCEFQ